MPYAAQYAWEVGEFKGKNFQRQEFIWAKAPTHIGCHFFMYTRMRQELLIYYR